MKSNEISGIGYDLQILSSHCHIWWWCLISPHSEEGLFCVYVAGLGWAFHAKMMLTIWPSLPTNNDVQYVHRVYIYKRQLVYIYIRKHSKQLETKRWENKQLTHLTMHQFIPELVKKSIYQHMRSYNLWLRSRWYVSMPTKRSYCNT